jgi:hypothetical protein
MITTKDKSKFLKSERNWFLSMTNKDYKKYMHNDAESCKKCGVYYWKNCIKRCKCE